MNLLQKEIKNEIMATDIFICIYDEIKSKSEIQDSLGDSFNIFKNIEKRFSRFLSNNELASFNKTPDKTQVSDDLLEMLEKSLHYYTFTNGAFDISILPDLIREGYNVSKKAGYHKDNIKNSPHSPTPKNLSKLTDFVIDRQNKTVTKPKDLLIDLGGIAKGYAADKVSKFLTQKYQNFLVDAGGDIYASGTDLKNKYQYWAVDIENPLLTNTSTDTLTITNKGIATSGINRRVWTKDGVQKNHIIDPRTGKSVSNDILSVTVVSETTAEADVLAKSLLIMGSDTGIKFCNNNSIAAYFIDKNLKVYKSSKMNGYVWKK